MSSPIASKKIISLLAALLLASCVTAPQEISSSRVQGTNTYPNQPASPALDLVPAVTPAEQEQANTTAAKTPVALLLPLSGHSAEMGKAMLNAAQLALFDLNEKHINLMPFDTKDTAAGAIEAANQAMEGGAKLILGPLFSHSTQAIMPFAHQHNVPILSFSNNVTVAGNGVYMMGFNPQQQIERIVSYALKQNINDFAVIVPNDAYGKMVTATLQEKLKLSSSSARVLRIEYFFPGEKALIPALKRLAAAIKESSATRVALLAPDAATLPIVLKNWKDIDKGTAQITLLGSGQWDDPKITGDANAVGSWFASAPSQDYLIFAKRYQDVYSSVPPRLASLSYDAVSLAGSILRNNQGIANFTADNLTLASGFMGIDGIFRLRPDGRSERGLAIMEVTPEGVRTIEDAPREF